MSDLRAAMVKLRAPSPRKVLFYPDTGLSQTRKYRIKQLADDLYNADVIFTQPLPKEEP